jgi:hypothetical protein
MDARLPTKLSQPDPSASCNNERSGCDRDEMKGDTRPTVANLSAAWSTSISFDAQPGRPRLRFTIDSETSIAK